MSCTLENDFNTTVDANEKIDAFRVARLLESLLVIIGNVIVIVVFIRTRELRKRKFYLLINLAIADFLVGARELPMSINKLSEIWEFSWSDWVNTFLFNFVTFASLIDLMLISVERLYATLWPFKHRVLTNITYFVFIALSWTLAISLPVLYAVPSSYCNSTIAYVYFSFIGLSLLIICFSCIIIWVKLKFGERPSCNVNSAAQDRKLTTSLLIVIVVSFVTCVPHLSVQVAIDIFDKNNPRLHSIAEVLLVANSLVNPIIYAFRMPQFRRAALRLICRRSVERRTHPIEVRNRAEAVVNPVARLNNSLSL